MEKWKPLFSDGRNVKISAVNLGNKQFDIPQIVTKKYYLAMKRNDKLIHVIPHRWNLKALYHVKKSQSLKNTHIMTPFILNVWNWQVYRDYCCLPRPEKVVTATVYKVFLGMIKCSKITVWWWLHNSVDILNIIELPILFIFH